MSEEKDIVTEASETTKKSAPKKAPKSNAAKASAKKSTTAEKTTSGTTKSATTKSVSAKSNTTSATKSTTKSSTSKSTSAKTTSSAAKLTAAKSAYAKSSNTSSAKKATANKSSSNGAKKKTATAESVDEKKIETAQPAEENIVVASMTENYSEQQTVQTEQSQVVEQNEVAATDSQNNNTRDTSEQKIVVADDEQTEKFGKVVDLKESDTAEQVPDKKCETGDTPLLSVRNLKKYFLINNSIMPKNRKYLRAVDGVSFDLFAGKTIGIVGESGCGKTTMGRTILRLTDVTGGEVMFKGIDLAKLKGEALRKMRPQFQMIFQDPYSSLSPRMPVGEIIGEAVKVHKIVPKSEYKDYILDIMQKCGLQTHYFERYPHEFSGGQRQRICIAKVLALKPQLVICDEPVSALDVSIQAQIINLFKDLQDANNLAYVFISHDLSVVEHISDDVGVMYLGNMVELAPKRELYDHPKHPYTEALLSAVPMPDPSVKMNRITLKGDIPSPANPPKGCKFHTRCTKCMDICKEAEPEFHDCGGGHFVACHLHPPKKDPVSELNVTE